MEEVISARDLTKVYPDGTEALRGISFTVERRGIVTLLGRNGAGKTTFVRIAATLSAPTSGSLEVLGMDVLRDARSVRQRIALMPQESYPPTFPRPGELVEAYLVARGWGLGDARRKAREILEDVGLWEYRDKTVSELSGGMKRKVILAMVLASGADLMFLDEPTVGLDPQSRRSIWRILEEARREGRAMLLTTHYMEEAEALSDDVIILDRGRLVAHGGVQEIVARVGATHKLEVSDFPGAAEGISRYGRIYRYGSRIVLYSDRKSAEEAAARLVRGHSGVLRVKEVGLEDAFVLLTGGAEPLGEGAGG
ncbi:MAG: ABC transporter ATP-binding protein [Conexivisphaera sp.]|jgi:ABC-2 type transport system ATP-binding protein|nr:ABC transporter ATP-binding protein [Conexivisphaerales archaeon]